MAEEDKVTVPTKRLLMAEGLRVWTILLSFGFLLFNWQREARVAYIVPAPTLFCYETNIFDRWPKVAFISACIGTYEKSTKHHVPQSIDCDFIFFTDVNIDNRGNWEIDRTPYHLLNLSRVDTGVFRNSFVNNKHSFNMAKFYKEQFYLIPRLSKYDIVIWLDATIEIKYSRTAEYVCRVFRDRPEMYVQTIHHHSRFGILQSEVKASRFFRYTSTFWAGQPQPFQDVEQQYRDYIREGYNESYWKDLNIRDLTYRNNVTTHYGVWVTCFVAWNMAHSQSKVFLDLWFLENLRHTTQDQVSFPYVAQKLRAEPYTYPDSSADRWYEKCEHQMFYDKLAHGL